MIEISRFSMLRRWFLFFCCAIALRARDLPPSPPDIYGELFVAVQMGNVFPDQKTFVDCVPRESPDKILADFARERTRTDFNLRAFVDKHFLVPAGMPQPTLAREPIEQHLKTLWLRLRRNPDMAVPGSSLLPLPYPYIVPGGRFREVYYWDSYFTMLGLHESGEDGLIQSMVDNFAYLESEYGVIPNGNRTYFASRSQPPFFSFMVELLAENTHQGSVGRYAETLSAEYDYWMDRTAPTHHVVTMPDGAILNRYWDRLATPRPEAYAKEEAVAARSHEPREELFRNLRAAAESGWDFSSRWFADGKSLDTIQTTDLLPVDLNGLLYHLEKMAARAWRERGDATRAHNFEAAAEARARAIRKYFWSERDGYFFDYNLRQHGLSAEPTLAGVVPLFVGVATPDQGHASAAYVEKNFLRTGGVVTTLRETGQQWDAPNGWAPLQWLTIRGVENYGAHELAAEIARRWLALNRRVYRDTGKMMEKYDVVHADRAGGGGEYPSQDGFGWTNGVFLKLAADYRDSH